MRKRKTTISGGIEWAVVLDGRVHSLHRLPWAADREAERVGGVVLSTPNPRTESLALGVGDECVDFAGMVIPA